MNQYSIVIINSYTKLSTNAAIIAQKLLTDAL